MVHWGRDYGVELSIMIRFVITCVEDFIFIPMQSCQVVSSNNRLHWNWIISTGISQHFSVIIPMALGSIFVLSTHIFLFPLLMRILIYNGIDIISYSASLHIYKHTSLMDLNCSGLSSAFRSAEAFSSSTKAWATCSSNSVGAWDRILAWADIIVLDWSYGVFEPWL